MLDWLIAILIVAAVGAIIFVPTVLLSAWGHAKFKEKYQTRGL